MNYAVVQFGGKQYKISEGDLLIVDRIDKEINSLIEFSDVLLLRNDENISIGTPNFKGASVSGTIVAHGKGEKIKISKFKAKVRYRRNMGFRSLQTSVRIDKISVNTDKTAPKIHNLPRKKIKSS